MNIGQEIKHENYKEIFIFKGKWDEEWDSYPHYHTKNIIKDTPTLHEIILPMLRGRKTYLELKVPQFICKNCGKHGVRMIRFYCKCLII